MDTQQVLRNRRFLEALEGEGVPVAEEDIVLVCHLASLTDAEATEELKNTSVSQL